jgi:hypothetical protein
MENKMTKPDNQTINMKLVLAAAEIAEPRLKWSVMYGSVRAPSAPLDHSTRITYFDLQAHSEDREALMLALMKKENGWWGFEETSNHNKDYRAKSGWGDIRSIFDQSFPLLLLKCVSAMKGIQMYV